ncbi:MAG: cytochrome P450 [Gammaproteobacteria bacterium AqS3]|nr:cytochrome P450 [Gammaproteobacteria bacterium AqS3]
MIGLISDAVTQRGNVEPVYGQACAGTPPVNLLDLDLFRQGPPFAAFAQMRSASPLMWHHGSEERMDASGFWAVTGYDAVTEISRNTEIFSSQRGGIHILLAPPGTENPMPALLDASLNNMICMDGDIHSSLRREHAPFFTPEAVTELKLKVDAEIDRLLDEMEAAGPEVDFVEMFSSQLPLFTLSEILGIPAEDRHKLVRWMHYLEIVSYVTTAGLDSVDVTIDEAFIQATQENLAEMFEYGQKTLHSRRENSAGDLLSAIAWAELQDSLLSDNYLNGSWLLIVFAGNDTTRNTLSGTLDLLTRHPGQRARLTADLEGTLDGMVDESLRYISPVQHMRRTATRDAEVAGQRIAEGEKVVMWYAAANRDPAVFKNPEQWDITRGNADKHVAFGFGRHKCIGHRVARMQLQSAYRKILRRFPNIEICGEMDIAPNNFVYAIRKLPVRLNA